MAQAEPAAGEQDRGERRPHALELGRLADHLAQVLAALEDRLAQRLQQVAGGGVVVEVLEGGDDDLAGDVAGRVAAHAVGDGQQPGPGVDRVLVVAADQAAVGARRIPQDERHASSSPALAGVRAMLVTAAVASIGSSSQARSRTQLQCGLADADRLAGVDQQRALDPLLVEVGAVGGAEVLHVPLATPVGEPRVAGAGEVVGQHEGGVVGAADQDRLVPEGDLGAGQRAGGDDEGARALLAALLARGGGARRDGRPPGRRGRRTGRRAPRGTRRR